MPWQIHLPSFVSAQAEIFLAIWILCLTLVGLFAGRHAFRATYIGSIIGIVITFLLTLKVSFLLNHTTMARVTFNGLFISDVFSIYAKIFVISGVGLILAMIRSSLIQTELAFFEYPILTLTSTLAMLLMISANDLLSLFVALELMSLSLYILIALKRKDLKASEASLKYFILSALATGIFLYGASWIYGYSGTTNYEVLERFLSAHTTERMPYLIMGFMLVISGIAFKVSAAPFHMWAPDVYQGTPTPVLSFLSTVPKFVAFIIVLRLITGPFHHLMPHASIIFLILSVGSMLIGAFAALTQQSIKRFIAYSSIGQIGFALIGVYLAVGEGYHVTLLFLVYYLITMIGFMACLVHLSRRGHALSTLADLNGLGKHHPIISFCLGFFVFSLMGIPPMPGFLPKLMIIQATVHQGHYALSIVAVLYSVIAAAYYLLFIKAIFIDQPLNEHTDIASLKTSGAESLIVAYGLVATLLSLIFYPNPLIAWTSYVAASLLYF
ncbi:MAG: NADH-quinone oxidoreductase subunit N [Candidatus Paracaedibacteraceae bacterium]|nr:NADH-quinone oxidoreductase subunit N [Candidatus Paracaedibacteraceae bacterium]